MASSERSDMMTLKAHWKGMVAMTIASLSSFQYGLDFGIIGGLQAMVPFLKVFGHEDPATPLGWNISSKRQQLISSLMILGAFVMSSSAGFTSRWFGRKMSLWFACVLVFVSTAMMQVTEDIGELYAARLIIGLANGLLMTHSQLYIQEILPAKYRGLGIAVFNYWVGVGSLVGTIIDNFAEKIPSKQAYVIPLGIVHVVPGILFICLFFIPESPRWLAQRGQMAKAERSLTWLRPRGWPVSEELTEVEIALAAESQLQSSVGFMDCFKNPIDRRRTFLAILSLTLQAASGAMYLISYGTYFFQMAGVGDAFENAVILTAVGVIASMINSAIITRWGYRRRMMMTGFVFCGLSQLITAVVYTVEPGTQNTGKVIVGLGVVYIIAFNAMLSPYAWLAGGELPSQRLRSYTFGLATAIAFFGAWLTTFTAPYFINPDSLNWGAKYGYVWAPSCLISLVWIYFFLPEAKDRTLEEIDEMFEARLPARKFRGYKCTGSHAALEDGDKKDDVQRQFSHDEGDIGPPGATQQHIISDVKK